nr:hypothetical protein [Arsenophonus endosymbiont of Aleurodicus floccissimus]
MLSFQQQRYYHGFLEILIHVVSTLLVTYLGILINLELLASDNFCQPNKLLKHTLFLLSLTQNSLKSD